MSDFSEKYPNLFKFLSLPEGEMMDYYNELQLTGKYKSNYVNGELKKIAGTPMLYYFVVIMIIMADHDVFTD